MFKTSVEKSVYGCERTENTTYLTVNVFVPPADKHSRRHTSVSGILQPQTRVYSNNPANCDQKTSIHVISKTSSLCESRKYH